MEDRVSAAADDSAIRRRRFPAGFLWGAATASHQVEGGNRWNDWWEYESSGRLPFASGDCCRHYELYEQDFDLARSLGHNCHRLSLEWSRIEPEDGQWNPAAIEHYGRVIRALKARGIEPVVTLHHFTLPAWFLRRGGWECADSARIFARFVAYAVQQIGEPVGYWLTINEPTVYVLQSYINGEWPPLQLRSWLKAGRVLRNLARAHVAAFDAIKRSQPDAKIGFAHNALWMEPCDRGRFLDRMAARIRDIAFNRVFFGLIGLAARGLSRRKLDFVGLNYYTRCCVRFESGGPSALLGRSCKLEHHADGGPRSSMGWEIYPRGLAAVLQRYSAMGLPLFITENGIATGDDELRCRFLHDHIEVIANALDDGLEVLGYLHWSLLDNFEWSMGTGPRFGLVAVDYSTQARIARPSATFFAAICRHNGL